MSGANLTNTNLCKANLEGANLNEANLTNAYIDIETTKFNKQTTLPNGKKWTPDTDLLQFGCFLDKNCEKYAEWELLQKQLNSNTVERLDETWKPYQPNILWHNNARINKVVSD